MHNGTPTKTFDLRRIFGISPLPPTQFPPQKNLASSPFVPEIGFPVSFQLKSPPIGIFQLGIQKRKCHQRGIGNFGRLGPISQIGRGRKREKKYFPESFRKTFSPQHFYPAFLSIRFIFEFEFEFLFTYFTGTRAASRT